MVDEEALAVEVFALSQGDNAAWLPSASASAIAAQGLRPRSAVEELIDDALEFDSWKRSNDGPAWEEEQEQEQEHELIDDALELDALSAVTSAELRAAAVDVLATSDVNVVTLSTTRHALEAKLNLAPGALESRREEIRGLILEVLADKAKQNPALQPHNESDLGEEAAPSVRRMIYLVTFARPAAGFAADGSPLQKLECFTREAICVALRHALSAAAMRAEFNLISVFQEAHEDGAKHFHAAVKANKQIRFLPVKQQLLAVYGLASHWSVTHDGYATAVGYCYLPSPRKPLAQLDPAPFLWAAEGSHPPLAEASRAPINANALAVLREKARRGKAEEGKAEPRFRDVDIWPIVVSSGIKPGPSARDDLICVAKKSGGQAMVTWCWSNWDKLPGLIERAWAMEAAEASAEQRAKSRVELLHQAASGPCTCAGRWPVAAEDLFVRNGLDREAWAAAVLSALENGRRKGNVVCHAGIEGDEGKSFLLQPLIPVFGSDKVFGTPSKSAFPMIELPSARIALLDDWRFNEEVIPFNVQLLWLEGKPFWINRPQNQHAGHLNYTDDAPVFVTTLASDISRVKPGLQPGDIDMLLKRLCQFQFHAKLENPDRTIPACGHCFAILVLAGKSKQDSASPSAGPPAVSKRGPQGHTGSTPDQKRAACGAWRVEDVVRFLKELELGHLEQVFRLNGVDGRFLFSLSEAELVSELGLSRLQARKVKLSLTSETLGRRPCSAIV